jgi:hypothetical protein
MWRLLFPLATKEGPLEGAVVVETCLLTRDPAAPRGSMNLSQAREDVIVTSNSDHAEAKSTRNMCPNLYCYLLTILSY